MIKDESEYIQEWIAHYFALGVQHFVIYDNLSTDNINKSLKNLINAGIVTLIYWPKTNGQIDAFNHAHSFAGNLCEYMGFLDTDEFIVLHDKDTLHDYLTSVDADQILIPWKNFGYCGHMDKPLGPTVSAYTIAKNQNNVQVKHFFRPSMIAKAGVHSSIPVHGSVLKFENGDLAPHTHICEKPVYKRAQVNHYQTRSFSEFKKRVLKGEAAHFLPKSIPPFSATVEIGDKNKIDQSAVKYASSTLSIANKFNTWSDQPHRYGLRQEALFSENKVIYHFITALGNFLSGAEKPSNSYSYEFMTSNTRSDNVEKLVPLRQSLLLECYSITLASQSKWTWDEFLSSLHFASFSLFYPLFSKENQSIAPSGVIKAKGPNLIKTENKTEYWKVDLAYNILDSEEEFSILKNDSIKISEEGNLDIFLM